MPLRELEYISRTSVTNEELLDAAARCAIETEDIGSAEELYSALWDECDMSLAFALNDMDLHEYFN